MDVGYAKVSYNIKKCDRDMRKILPLHLVWHSIEADEIKAEVVHS